MSLKEVELEETFALRESTPLKAFALISELLTSNMAVTVREHINAIIEKRYGVEVGLFSDTLIPTFR